MVRLIVGCGYLGMRVTQKWLDAGDQVVVISRSQSRRTALEQKGLQVLLADITDVGSLKQLSRALPKIDTVLFAVGFDRSKYDDIRDVYVKGLENFLDHAAPEFNHFIYISSTGVYGPQDVDEHGWVTEESSTNPIRPGGVACLEAEQLLFERFGDRTTVLRLAGIYGPGRVANLRAIQNQQWDKLTPSGHLNLIHVADAAEIVVRIAGVDDSGDAASSFGGETFLVSDGVSVERKRYYEHLAESVGVTIDWKDQLTAEANQRVGKRVNNKKLSERLALVFAFPSYREGIAGLLSELVDESDSQP